MDHTLYFRILLMALCSLSECARQRYHYVNITKSWSAAQNYCRENFQDLATVTNMKDMEQLIESVTEREDVWIGLENTNNHISWKWSLGDPVTYQNWENDQSAGKNHCASMKNTKWHNQNCTMTLSFVCYNESSKTYIVEPSQKTWREAQSFCKQNHHDLASVRNKKENEEIEKVINSLNAQTEVWIGLFRDSWVWSDNSTSSFRNWLPGEPNGGTSHQCTEAWVKVTNEKIGQWNDAGCSAERTFVCHGQDTLVLIKENLSWSEALEYCRQNHVDLVSVDSEEIQRWVKEVVKEASTAEVWLGLRHTCIVGIWFSVNGEIVCYHNWAPGNGTAVENCDTAGRSGAVQSSGQQHWISLPETHKLNFICTKL